MKRDYIKAKLREGIDSFLNLKERSKAPANTPNDAPSKEEPKTSEPAGKKDYADVQRAIDKIGGPSMVDVMKLIGIEDDEKGVNRSLFRKKIKQEKNDTGSYYQFDDDELAQVRAALSIKK